MQVGILALQGAVQPHRAKFAEIGVEAISVRLPADLDGCAGLVIPGGESTTLLKLMAVYNLFDPLISFAREKSIWGVCAGAILMAQEVTNPSQRSLGILPIRIRRNGYGRQNESFVCHLEMTLPEKTPVHQEGVFIRAPQVENSENGVVKLAEYNGLPVALTHGGHLLTTFHPELSPGTLLHSYFMELLKR